MSGALAFAALTLQLGTLRDLRILPAGAFAAADGRPGPGKSWTLPPTRGAQLVQAANDRENDYAIDYEHQTALVKENGQPAPAAGWFKQLEWRDDGLHAVDVRWTPRAQAALTAKEFRYISPYFQYDKDTLEVTRLVNVALTNMPALPQLGPVAALTLQAFATPLNESRNGVSKADREEMARRFGMSLEKFDEMGREQNAEAAAFEAEPMTDTQVQMFANMFAVIGRQQP